MFNKLKIITITMTLTALLYTSLLGVAHVTHKINISVPHSYVNANYDEYTEGSGYNDIPLVEITNNNKRRK